MDKIQVVCRDFLNGVCRFGDRCRFLHILPQESKIKICYDFLNSTCKFGKRCRFSHEFGNEKPRLNTSSSNIGNSQDEYSFEDSAFSSNIGNSQDITLNPNPRLNTSSSNIGNSQDEYSFEDSAFSSINIRNSQDRALNKEPRLNVSSSSSSSSSSRSIRNSQDRALNKEPRLNVSSSSSSSSSSRSIRNSQDRALNKEPRLNVSSSSSSSNIRNSQDEILNPKTKPCYNFSKGTCSYGDACMFSHKLSNIRNSVDSQIFGKTVQIGSIRVKMEDGLKVVKILNDMDDSLLILTYYPNTWVNIVKIHDDILRLSHGQYNISLKKIEFNKRRLMLYFNYLDIDIENFFRSLTMCIEHKVINCKNCNPKDFDKFYIDKYINNCHEVIVKNTTISSVDNYLKKHNIIPLLVLPIKGTRNFTIRFEYQADTEKLIFDTKSPFAIEMGDFIVIHIKPEILNVIGGQIIEDYIKESIPKKDFKSIVMPKIQVSPDKSNIRIIGGNLIGRMKIRQIISNLNKPDIIKVNDCVLKHIDNPLICTFIGMTNCIISINYGKILVYGIENDRRIVVTTIERYLELEDNKYSKIRFDITKAEKNLVIAANNERQIKGCQHFKKYVKDSNIRYIYVFEGTAKSVTDTLCMMTRILGPDGYKYILHDEDIESTQECVACFSTAINPVTLSCGCVHCKDCFKRQLLFDSRPSVNCVCNTPITIKDIALAELTDPEKEQVYNIRLNIFIQSTNVYKYCLTPNCEQLFIPSGNKLFNCRKCSAIYCITCDSPYVDYNLSHEGMSCSAFQSLKKTDHEYLAWVRDHTKPCANCGSNIEKNGGCNHMTCKCKYEFCYLCNRKWKAAGCTIFGATCDLTKN